MAPDLEATDLFPSRLTTDVLSIEKQIRLKSHKIACYQTDCTLNAWATANHLRLAQTIVDQKSNEITAILKLLEIIEVFGGLVTIDAMGCQTEIAAKIIDEGADY